MVKSHFRHSIVSGKVADDLYKVLPKDGTIGTLGPLPDGTGRLEVIWLSARRLTRGRTQQDQPQLSGGVKIEAWTQGAPNVGAPSWCSKIVRRLGPGWTREQFRRAASLCYSEARSRAHRELLQENLFARFQLYANDEALIQAAEKAGQEQGRTTVYGDMTEDDCSFWYDWLNEYLARVEGNVVAEESRAEDLSQDWRNA